MVKGNRNFGLLGGPVNHTMYQITMKNMNLKWISAFLFLGSLMGLGAQDFSALQYRTVGPVRGGRVTTVTGIASQPGTFYLGASGGGVWKSEDYGTTWNNVSDGYFETPSIGAIEVAQNDPNIVYVGTGSDGLRSNVISGKGMYRSIDGAKTWEAIGLREAGQIGAVEIDPTNSNIVWVAAIGNAFRANEERGVYKTTNGGQSWQKVLHISDSVGFADIELLPGNPNVAYAAAWKAQRKPWTIISGGDADEGGIYKTVNGGKDWVKLTMGLPKGTIGKIDLAVSPADSSILYAIIEAPKGEQGLYKSTDQGKSFQHISDDVRLVNRPFYYTNVEVDPTNPDIVYSNANPLLKSMDGGHTWKPLAVPHGDNHDIWINPNNPNLLIQANDGGANVSHNSGKTWSTQFNQPTAELYQVEVDDQYPYWLYAGQQDNSSTIAVPSFPPSAVQNPSKAWILNTGGCETGPAVPKPGNPNIVYANCKGRFSVFNKLTGTEKAYYVGASNIYGHNPKDLRYRFQRVAPIHVSPHNPDVVYHGSQYLHKTDSDGYEWETISPDLTAFEADKQVISGSPITRDITGEEYYSTLYSIRESPIQEGVIWTGSNDGVVSLTRDGGKTWNKVTPKKLPKGGRVESIAPSHFNAATAYIAVDRHLLGDDSPYLYKTNDFGKSWTLLSKNDNGIAKDHTARVLREDPVKKGLLYAGTEFGMYVSFDDGATWQPFQQNLPVTPITDIKLVRGDLVLSTMGRGFWILDNITSLRQKEITTLDKAPVLFKPDDTYRYQYPKISTPSFPDFPRTAVYIDYYLPETMESAVQLDILDAKGTIISRIVSERDIAKTPIEEVENMDLSTTFRLVNKTLDATQGFHRFAWDLRTRGAWHKEPKRRYQGGPMALPGTYTARLTVGDTILQQEFDILMDPKVKAQGLSLEDLKVQQQMQRQVHELLSEARKLEAALEGEIKTLKRSGDTISLAKKEVILERLQNADGAYPQQMLLSQIAYLQYAVGSKDQLPGKDAQLRLRELQEQLKVLKENTVQP
ncbi:Glycosyl hydrolase, BNR repeat-containing protein [Croceitalea dokdonensis DOKDO 023]|uniref:Glycosyl hydrolase, BNR repeat-containing protein n=2 Tax=Croceitalea TaxID=574891 RepID=A0A0P7AND3_9FLAO|nr:Glycosyl hydrolase, BNR repeat-containing protein [Croceitalea dokdonensis DOKDO 023]